jgi:hypothetical protein
MTADFTAIRRRVAKAKRELDALRADVDAFCDAKPWRLEREDGPLSEALVAYVDRDPDPEWGDEIGVIAYRARSALDHVVRQVVIDSGNVPTDRTHFPIYADAAEYFGTGRQRRSPRDRMLTGVASRHRRVIDNLQPYQRGAQARRDPLFLLNAIGNRDKHNDTHAVWGAVTGTRFRIVRPDGTSFTVTINKSRDPLPLVHEQRVIGIDSQPDDGVSKMRLEVDAVNLGLVFAGKVTVSLDHIETALQHVAAIVNRFEQRVTRPRRASLRAIP